MRCVWQRGVGWGGGKMVWMDRWVGGQVGWSKGLGGGGGGGRGKGPPRPVNRWANPDMYVQAPFGMQSRDSKIRLGKSVEDHTWRLNKLVHVDIIFVAPCNFCNPGRPRNTRASRALG
jgi:hypothetical protein